MNKPSQSEFNQAKEGVSMLEILQLCISYKKSIQTSVIPSLTQTEIADIRDCNLNQTVIDKLCQLGAWQAGATNSILNLYACAMSIGTIIKEYDWGTYYISPEGLYELACRIIDKKPINW